MYLRNYLVYLWIVHVTIRFYNQETNGLGEIDLTSRVVFINLCGGVVLIQMTGEAELCVCVRRRR